MDEKSLPLYFELFNEIGIIEQLSRAQFESVLPKGFLISHFSVLNHLIRVKDGRTPLELAKAFQVAKTTMTHTLSGLEKAELVQLQSNPDDGRSKLVWITPQGRSFRENAIGSMGQALSKFSESFPENKIGELVPHLTEIRKYMDQARDSNTKGI